MNAEAGSSSELPVRKKQEAKNKDLVRVPLYYPSNQDIDLSGFLLNGKLGINERGLEGRVKKFGFDTPWLHHF